MSSEPAQPALDLKLRARLREGTLQKAYRSLVKNWSPEEQAQCTLNGQLVRMVSESYFADLERKKDFHDITYADAHKRAGYMAKWIMRYRPIQLLGEDCNVKALLANEHFALGLALKFLKVSPSALPPKLWEHMVYSMRYRPVDGNAWAMSFYLLQQAYGKKTEV
jgi:hypothetical protein